MNDTICAISTAGGLGAIAIVRASGEDVIDIVTGQNNQLKGVQQEVSPSLTNQFCITIDMKIYYLSLNDYKNTQHAFDKSNYNFKLDEYKKNDST